MEEIPIYSIDTRPETEKKLVDDDREATDKAIAMDEIANSPAPVPPLMNINPS